MTKKQPSHDRESYLQLTARDGIQLLLGTLYQPSPRAKAPSPNSQTRRLPRTKPLPKPKPPTKLERFAPAKGIQSHRHDKKIWDDERQSWVPRWGLKGKNREEMHTARASSDISYSSRLKHGQVGACRLTPIRRSGDERQCSRKFREVHLRQ